MASRAYRGAGPATRESVQAVVKPGSQQAYASALVTIPDRPDVIGQGLVPGAQAYQDELYRLVKGTPEAMNAIGWLTHGTSRADMFACELTPQGLPGVRTTDAAVIAAVEPLLGPMNRADFLELAAWYLLVPGEYYLFGWEDEQAKRRSAQQRWSQLDPINISTLGSKGFQVKYERNGAKAEQDVTRTEAGGLSLPLIRQWNPDEREPWNPTSLMLANLQVLQAIDKMTRLVPALADQRIAGPRILAVSNRIEAPEPPPGRRFSKDKIVDRLARAVDVAKRNPSAIENLLPIILSGDLTDKVFEKLEWSTEYPELTVEIMTLLIQRLATGLPVPSEVTLGEGQTSHWGQWFTEESTVKLSIEPLVNKIAAGLSRDWLPSVMATLNSSEEGSQETGPAYEIDDWVIGYDIRTVMLRPDRSAIAVQVFDRRGLSFEALRRETGFDEKDAPTPEELAERDRLATGGDSTPGPDPGQGSRQPTQQVDLDPEAGRSTRELPSTGSGDAGSGGAAERGLQAASMNASMNGSLQSSSSLHAAARVAMTAALGRTGSYLKGSTREARVMLGDYPACERYLHASDSMRLSLAVDTLWPEAVLEEFVSAAAEAGYSPDCAEGAMRAHLAALVTTGRPHCPEDLMAALDQCTRVG